LSCHHTATSEIYPLSLHDALPIYLNGEERVREELEPRAGTWLSQGIASAAADFEDRLRATQTRALTPNQEDQLASFGLRSRAKDGSVEEARSGCSNRGAQLEHPGGSQRAALEHQRLCSDLAEGAARVVEPELSRGVIVSNHRDHDVRS